MNALQPQARLLYRGALLIFVVTIVIGILNGLDIWDPTHQMVLTHVHAGTLGWITLAVVASALNGRTDRRVTVVCDGGQLEVDWTESGEVRQVGEVEIVFEGRWIGPPVE